MSIDSGQICCLVLLDLSAAFDTLDVDLILNRLQYRFGFGGKVLEWIRSYLMNRSQSVEINGTISNEKSLKYGVPQGSLLGPKIFSNFVAPVGEICRRHGIGYHGYADDTQNYLTFKLSIPQSRENCFRTLQDCIQEIKEWMLVCKLKLNCDKTEFLVVGSRSMLNKIHRPLSIRVGEYQIESVNHVRNLGFWFDEHLSNNVHVNKICSNSMMMLRNIRSIRYKLDEDTTKTLVQCLVISRIDYCNSLLLGTPKYLLNRLQKLLNMGARIVFCIKKYDHVTQCIIDLHWLKVQERIIYKVLLIIHKSLKGTVPAYLKSMFQLPKRGSLRSENSGKLFQPKARTSGMLKSSFVIAGSIEWNKLPCDIRSQADTCLFKKKLKTHLFVRSFY